MPELTGACGTGERRADDCGGSPAQTLLERYEHAGTCGNPSKRKYASVRCSRLSFVPASPCARYLRRDSQHYITFSTRASSALAVAQPCTVVSAPTAVHCARRRPRSRLPEPADARTAARPCVLAPALASARARRRPRCRPPVHSDAPLRLLRHRPRRTTSSHARTRARARARQRVALLGCAARRRRRAARGASRGRRRRRRARRPVMEGGQGGYKHVLGAAARQRRVDLSRKWGKKGDVLVRRI